MTTSAKRPLNVLIVGGVAGGMSCATRLRRNDEDARITVLDRGSYVSYANCGIPYALGGVITSEDKLHVQTPTKIKSWFNIDVRTNTELVAIDRGAKTVRVRSTAAARADGKAEPGADADEEVLGYDKLVLALGAEAVRPPIKGVADAPNVFTLQTIPDLQAVQAYVQEHRPRSAAVVGAGFIGLEAAENLRMLDLDVTVVEMVPHVFPPVDADLATVLHDELERNDVHVLVSSKVTEVIYPKGSEDVGNLLVEKNSGAKVEVPADLVILSAGVRPRVSLAVDAGLEKGGKGGLTVNEQMQTSDPDIYAVGDMVETANLATGRPGLSLLAGPANRQGRLAADHMSGKAVSYRGNVSAAVCKVFGKTVGIVGQSTDALLGAKDAGTVDFVTVHPPDHAGYYPGAVLMTLRLAFARPTGRILGAQAVGSQGVDKRIDVLATAMRAGMAVEDLAHLELGYAPPYGAAKDPVNMAGFAAGNVLAGDVKVVHARDFAAVERGGAGGEGKKGLADVAGVQVVDVRSAEEYARGHVVGAKNVPIAELRDRMDELDRGRTTVVYCWVGYRGYLAARMLAQRGFDVANLDGGFKSVVEGGFKSLEA